MVGGKAATVPALETTGSGDEVASGTLAAGLPPKFKRLRVCHRMKGGLEAFVEAIRERVFHCQGSFGW